MANRVLLAIVFVLSFFTYLGPEPTMLRRSAPLIAFGGLVVVRVFFSRLIFSALRSLRSTDGLLYVVYLPLLMLGSSLSSSFRQSLDYWILISICLLLARLYMAVVPLQEVLEAFFWAGIASIGLLLAVGFSGLLETIETLARFSVFAFEPNVLAFILAGYFCVMIWKLMTACWQIKILAGLGAVICLVVIFFASSRGSLLGIAAGSSAAIVMVLVRARREGRSSLLRAVAWVSVAACSLGVGAAYSGKAGDVYGFVDQVLSLSSPERGLDSGLTGRSDKWRETIRGLSDGTWMFGHGMRSSDSMYQPIDNSYLVVLYELGLVPMLLIVWRFVAILWKCVIGYFRSSRRTNQHVFLLLSLMMVVFLVSDIVGRFMLALANPFSLLTFLLFAAPMTRIIAHSDAVDGFLA